MGIIAGIISFSQPLADGANRLEKMMHIQRHRGHGTRFLYANGNCALGMMASWQKRHDESHGIAAEKEWQQLRAVNGVFALTDGIILEQQSLRNEIDDNATLALENANANQLISALFCSRGVSGLEKVEGEFAAAIWDSTNAVLYLRRDPFGHKPLHYIYDRGRVLFSSEIKGILAAGLSAEIDMQHLSEFLTLNCIPYPGTIFKGIQQVPPGCVLKIEAGKTEVLFYWEPKVKTEKIEEPDAVEMFSQCLRKAVQKRILTEVPYCFLSGGIDSSAILSVAAELSGNRVQAVSIGFAEEEVNEIDDAAAMAKYVGVTHHCLIAKPDSFVEMLEKLVWHHDSPFTDTSAYPSYFAGKLAKSLTDVILTGDGPDQMLGGSSHHVYALKNEIFQPLPLAEKYFCKGGYGILSAFLQRPGNHFWQKASRAMYRKTLSPIAAAYDLRSYFPDSVKEFLVSSEIWQLHQNDHPFQYPERWFASVPDEDMLNRYLYADMVFYVPDDLMIKLDRMCMAHGVETLSPFQDVSLARLCNSLPRALKISLNEEGEVITKSILRKVNESRFPARIKAKPKQGFAIPVEKWLRHDGGKFIQEILLDPRTLKRGYFRAKALEAFVADFVKGRGDYYYPSPLAIVALLTLEIWNRQFIDSSCSINSK